MKNRPAKKMQSNQPSIRPGTYVVHSTSTQGSPQYPSNRSNRVKSRAKGSFISRGDPSRIRLPCIDNHLGVDGSRMNVAATPIDLRMAIRLNKVDLFKQKTQLPPGTLLPTNLPLWNQWPLDAKIPDFRDKSWPKESLYFARGKIGNSLFPRRQQFDLNDPKGYKNALPLADYTALHDPHAINYFKQRHVIPLLREQKLINSKNEVLCNAKDYNRFRAYLSTLQNEGVNQKLKMGDEKNEFQMKLRKPFHEFKMKEEYGDRAANRLSNAREFRKERAELQQSKANSQMEDWKYQNDAFERWKREERYQMIQELPVKDYISINRRRKVAADRTEERRRLLGKQLYDMKRGTYNQKYDALINKALRERRDIDKIITLKKRDEQVLELKDVIDETIRLRKEKWCQRYEKHIQYSHQNQKAFQLAKIEKNTREIRLQRKYFDLWRAFVIRKRNADKTDDVHQSSWKIDKDMKDTVAYLEEESGYDPHQDLFKQLLENRKNVEDWAEEQQDRVIEQQKQKIFSRKTKTNIFKMLKKKASDDDLADDEDDSQHPKNSKPKKQSDQDHQEKRLSNPASKHSIEKIPIQEEPSDATKPSNQDVEAHSPSRLISEDSSEQIPTNEEPSDEEMN